MGKISFIEILHVCREYGSAKHQPATPFKLSCLWLFPARVVGGCLCCPGNLGGSPLWGLEGQIEMYFVVLPVGQASCMLGLLFPHGASSGLFWFILPWRRRFGGQEGKGVLEGKDSQNSPYNRQIFIKVRLPAHSFLSLSPCLLLMLSCSLSFSAGRTLL